MTTGPILQVITSTQPRGAEIFAADLEHALRALGREVTTVALAPCDGSSLDVATLGSHALAPSTLRALRRAASSAAIVVAHGSTTLPACGLALMGTRVPFVYRNIGDPTYWARSPMRRLRVGAMLRRAAAVVAVSDAAADAIIERFGVARGRVTTIPTAVPEERFPPIDADERCRARAQLSLPTDGVVIAAVGALSPEKDLGLALEVTELAPDSHLLVAGDGPERARLERLANRRAPGRVHFTGWLADRGAAYAACDVVLQTSRSEGLPAVLIEAGARGLPVVARDVGYVHEVVVDGVTGVLVGSDDAPRFLAAIRLALEGAATLGQAARAHCLARFGMTSAASAWDAVLAETARCR